MTLGLAGALGGLFGYVQRFGHFAALGRTQGVDDESPQRNMVEQVDHVTFEIAVRAVLVSNMEFALEKLVVVGLVLAT